MRVSRTPLLTALAAVAAAASPLLLLTSFSPAAVCVCGIVLSAILTGASVIAATIAVRRRDRAEVRRSRALLSGGFDGVIIARDGRVLDANPAMCLMLDLTPGDVVGRPLSDLIASGYRCDSGWRASGPGCIRSEVDMVGASGVVVPVEILSRPLARVDGPARMLSVRDISRRRAARRQFGTLVTRDPLTALPNRCWLEGSLHTMLDSAGISGLSLAIVFVSVAAPPYDGDVPDVLLPLVGQRLRASVRAGDLVARLDRREFVVVQMPAEGPNPAAELVARLRDVMGQPYTVEDTSLTVTISVGAAVFPRDGATVEALLNNCTIIMQRGGIMERRRPRRVQSAPDAGAGFGRVPVSAQAMEDLYDRPRQIQRGAHATTVI
jgi:diguanylate cyclase (GGDEF)-like protein/PAS domain S-box-containing protein